MYESSGSGGGDDKRRDCPILHDYAVPPYFREDLFRMVGEHRRPPYRWFLVGPKRSGTCVHIDPLNTSAWNTLIYGLKRWVLFPPEFSRDEVKGRAHVRKDKGEDDEAVDYFNRILPRIKEAGGARMAAAIIEFVQRPGETVYVPGGWWHAVHNLTDTIAVTQNYCSTANFSRVWPATRDGRHGMARKWLRLLERERPDLYAAACAMNAADGWSMDAAAAKHKVRIAEKVAARAKRRAEREAAHAAKRARVAGAGGLVVDSDSSSSDSDSSTDSDESSGSDTSDSDEEAVAGAQTAVPRQRVDAASRGLPADSSDDEAAAGSSSGAGARAGGAPLSRATKKPRLDGVDGSTNL
jgi:histone arginine demethylase JMJD6